MSNTLPYAVFGATGRTGAAAADALLRAGLPVRVVLRDPARGGAWAARGAEIVQADLTDADALTRVLTGVRGAYVVSPQQYGRADLFELADRIAQTVARAAVAARVPKLVALSSVGADLASGSGWIRMNRMLEQRLSDSGIAATFLRAAYFMENWTPMIGQAVATGGLPSFLSPRDAHRDGGGGGRGPGRRGVPRAGMDGRARDHRVRPAALCAKGRARRAGRRTGQAVAAGYAGAGRLGRGDGGRVFRPRRWKDSSR